MGEQNETNDEAQLRIDQEEEQLQIDKTHPDAEMLIGRLKNWKFETAAKYCEGQPKAVVEIVKALAATFGNSGWFDGHLGTIVWATVESLMPND